MIRSRMEMTRNSESKQEMKSTIFLAATQVGLKTWGNYKLPFSCPLHLLPPASISHPFPLEVGLLNTDKRSRSAISSPSRVRGGAPAEIEFGVF